MMNIRDIRIVQKIRKGTTLVEKDGKLVIQPYKEMLNFELQIMRDFIGAQWEPINIIEELVEDENESGT